MTNATNLIRRETRNINGQNKVSNFPTKEQNSFFVTFTPTQSIQHLCDENKQISACFFFSEITLQQILVIGNGNLYLSFPALGLFLSPVTVT